MPQRRLTGGSGPSPCQSWSSESNSRAPFCRLPSSRETLPTKYEPRDSGVVLRPPLGGHFPRRRRLLTITASASPKAFSSVGYNHANTLNK
ncbi:hypothetical protein BV22DRAFT_920379 [Leucogyrophana mollusca]|uniref:Uncharacterized protein n=1 Tax=Leucogyrophana mollusca TaxID=85980 RepID=A0ACB8AXB3_9AGAM|nr:hypothetical protein BV22DRAFT_920379 [Leucogyrophana mollusca]